MTIWNIWENASIYHWPETHAITRKLQTTGSAFIWMGIHLDVWFVYIIKGSYFDATKQNCLEIYACYFHSEFLTVILPFIWNLLFSQHSHRKQLKKFWTTGKFMECIVISGINIIVWFCRYFNGEIKAVFYQQNFAMNGSYLRWRK